MGPTSSDRQCPGKKQNPRRLLLLESKGRSRISISPLPFSPADMHSLSFRRALLKVRVTVPTACYLSKTRVNLTFALWGILRLSAKIPIIRVAALRPQLFHWALTSSWHSCPSSKRWHSSCLVATEIHATPATRFLRSGDLCPTVAAGALERLGVHLLWLQQHEEGHASEISASLLNLTQCLSKVSDQSFFSVFHLFYFDYKAHEGRNYIFLAHYVPGTW